MGVTMDDVNDGLPNVLFDDGIQSKFFEGARLDDTIRAMKGLILSGSIDPRVVEIATRLSNAAAGRDFDGIAAALYRWTVKNIKYHRDPAGREYLQDWQVTLKRRAGDCDDFAIWGGTMLTALGVKVAIKIARISHATYDHVYIVYWSPRRNVWVAWDGSANKRSGWESPNVKESKLYPLQ